MFSAKPLRELRKASDDELIELHDTQAKHEGAGVEYYLNELNRRSQSQQTRSIVAMTAIILVATLFNTAFFVYSIVT